MGYDAYVRCNCFEEGETTTPPCPKEFIKEDDLEYLYLSISYDDDPELVNAFDKWTHNEACEHKDMEICSERLANASGMSAFRTIIQQLGIEKYPIITKHLPKSNGGHLPFKLANAMKHELKSLKQEVSDESLVVLNELTLNRRIQSTNSNYSLPFVFSGYNKLNYIISRNGFKVIRNKNFLGKKYTKELFVSKKFTQKKLGDKKYLFEDYDSKCVYESSINIFPDKNQNDDFFEFEVTEIKTAIADEYAYIIEPLLKLTKASLETGNPIIWC